MSLKRLPPGARPRERLAALGPGALSAPELLALLIGSGTAEASATALGERALARFEGPAAGLGGLASAGVADLARLPGWGPARASAVVAAFELGRRAAREPLGERPCFDSPAKVHAWLAPELAHRDREVCVALVLDTKHRLIASETVATGTATETLVHPREVFKLAIARSGAGLLVAHNHPSGDPTPSAADRLLTERLVRCGEVLGIPLVDHVIVGKGRYVSLREVSAIWTTPPPPC